VTEEVELILDGPPPEGKGSGSLAILAAIRRASSRDSNFALKHLNRLAITTSPEPPFVLPRFPRRRCATRHKLGIQRYKGRAGSQIATLFERAA